MATDAEKRKIWEQQIEKTLNSRAGGKSKYLLLRSNQLVGAALVIFIKSDIVHDIRNVESSIKKVKLNTCVVYLLAYISVYRQELWELLVTKALWLLEWIMEIQVFVLLLLILPLVIDICIEMECITYVY